MISIKVVTKIIIVEMFTLQYTSSDKVVDRCYHLLLIRKLTLNYSTLNKQLKSSGGVNKAVNDEKHSC